MFDISTILKRAWHILWDYKILWIFGFIMALTGAGATSGSGGGGGRGGFSGNYSLGQNASSFGERGVPYWLKNWFDVNFTRFFATPEQTMTTVLWVVVGLVLLGIVISLLLALFRYPAETAAIRMVNQHEDDGSKVGFKAGWKLGWNHRAFHMWLLDTILAIPNFLLGLLMLTGLFFIFLPYLKAEAWPQFSTSLIGAVVLVFLLLIPMALIGIVVGMLRPYVVRVKVIDDAGIGESLRQGWKLFTHQFKHTFLIWLVLLGVGIAVGVAMMLVFFLLIPAYAVMAIPGALVAAIPGGIGYGITYAIDPVVWPWVIGGLLFLPFFFAITFSPLSFVSGLVAVFYENVWTITFRQVRAIESGTALPPQPPVMAMPLPPVPPQA